MDPLQRCHGVRTVECATLARMRSNSKSYFDSSRRWRLSGRDRPRWMRKLGYWLWWITHDQAAPEAIARGIGVGVFAGILPMLGQSLVAIPLAWLVRGSKVVAAAMTFISNPVTTVPIFLFDYWVGCKILGRKGIDPAPENFESWEAISKLGTDFLVTIFTGGIVVGIVAGLVAWYLGHAYVLQSRRRKERRRKQRQEIRRQLELRNGKSSGEPTRPSNDAGGTVPRPSDVGENHVENRKTGSQ